MILRVDVGAHGEELVDGAETAAIRRYVKRGLALLRWRSGSARARLAEDAGNCMEKPRRA
jgi:hypothetical protein